MTVTSCCRLASIRVTCQIAEMLSQAGCTVWQVYWITCGCTGTPAKKAPDLKGSRQCPFVVVPCIKLWIRIQCWFLCQVRHAFKQSSAAATWWVQVTALMFDCPAMVAAHLREDEQWPHMGVCVALADCLHALLHLLCCALHAGRFIMQRIPQHRQASAGQHRPAHMGSLRTLVGTFFLPLRANSRLTKMQCRCWLHIACQLLKPGLQTRCEQGGVPDKANERHVLRVGTCDEAAEMALQVHQDVCPADVVAEDHSCTRQAHSWDKRAERLKLQAACSLCLAWDCGRLGQGSVLCIVLKALCSAPGALLEAQAPQAGAHQRLAG